MEAVPVKELPLVPLVNLQELFTLAVAAEVEVDKVLVHQLVSPVVRADPEAEEKAEMEKEDQRKTEPMALQIQVEAPAVAVLLVVIVATLGQGVPVVPVSF